MIEEDINQLQEIVRGLHGRLGHVWYRGSSSHDSRPFYRADCACGESRAPITIEEWSELPYEYLLNERF